jgi:hypothetical protein
MMFCFFNFFAPTNHHNDNRLYSDCPWDDKAIRKLIGDGKIAPRLKGGEYRTTNAEHECPICFLYYTDVNVTNCCNAHLCTECFLQVRPQKEKQAVCPFCNAIKFSVSVAKTPSEEEIEARQRDEQTVIEARIRVESGGGAGTAIENPALSTPTKKTRNASVAPNSSSNAFGSELEKTEQFQLLKKRSESFASNEGVRTPQKDAEIINSIAMTPEERIRLEEEMKAQHSHPLALRVEAEAQERRLQNEQAYYRSNSAGNHTFRAQRASDLFRNDGSTGAAPGRRLRYRTARDWNEIVEAYERGGNGEVNSLDDLVVLEAAILLSMEEEARRERLGDDFDAARHAREGFPLIRSLLGSPSEINRRGEVGVSEVNPSFSSLAAVTPSGLSDSAQNDVQNWSPGRRRYQSTRAAVSSGRSQGMMPQATLDAASFLMRGVSEEEQIAMAIAASLQEQQQISGFNNNSQDRVDHRENSSSSTSSSGRGDNSGSHVEDSSSSNEASEHETSTGNTLVEYDTNPLNELSEAGQETRYSSGWEGEASNNGATTITELARVVTDSGTDGETVRSSVASGSVDLLDDGI